MTVAVSAAASFAVELVLAETPGVVPVVAVCWPSTPVPLELVPRTPIPLVLAPQTPLPLGAEP